MRSFSIISTPSSGLLQFGMRVKGNFTQAAARLRVGDAVIVQGPFGEFTIDFEYDRRIVMLASGIGVTPFMGMLRHLTERQIKLPVTLLYSNHSIVNAPFREELQELAQHNPYLNIQFYCGDAATNTSDVVRGTITDAHVRQLTGAGYAGSTYFICGPENFGRHMHAALLRNKVHETQIISESFTQAGTVKMGWSGMSIRSLTYGLAAASFVLVSGFIMALDLSRAVPRLASAQSAATTRSKQTTTQSNTSDNSSSASNTSDSSAPSASTTTTPNQSYQQSQPSYQNYYQPPMSSVS